MLFLIFSDNVSHGNNCAGVIAGATNNGECGVGLAYNAKIAGLLLEEYFLKI